MAALGDDLLGTVNKLQDLVFNTIGNDSLDLPQIVRSFLISRIFDSLPLSELRNANNPTQLSRLSSVRNRLANLQCSKTSSGAIFFPAVAAS